MRLYISVVEGSVGLDGGFGGSVGNAHYDMLLLFLKCGEERRDKNSSELIVIWFLSCGSGCFGRVENFELNYNIDLGS
jgi:hypothetical protein